MLSFVFTEMALLLRAQAGHTFAFLSFMWASVDQALLICWEGEEGCLPQSFED